MEGYIPACPSSFISSEGAREGEREREPISRGGETRFARWRGGGWTASGRAGEGARERDGDGGSGKETKYGGGGCYGYTAAITIRVPSYSKLRSSPRSVSACVS